MKFFITSLFFIIISSNIIQVLANITCPENHFLVPESLSCVEICPMGYYNTTQEQQKTCLKQKSIKVSVHPTVEDRTFMLVFHDTPVPFQDSEEFEEIMKVNIQSDTEHTSINSSNFSAIFLTKDKTLLQFTININNIPIGSILKLIFPAFYNDQTRQSYIQNSPVFSSLPYSNFPRKFLDQLQAFEVFNRALEYGWIAVSCLNPYAFLYMSTKLTRETLEMFKRVNVNYDPFATRYFRENNYKVSGFKTPNMFAILLEDNPVTSGWNINEDNSLIGAGRERIQDFKLKGLDIIHSYDVFPLFLDNYGIQISVFIAIIAMIIIFEAANFIFANNKIFQYIRKFFRWNLLIASMIGSYQSLMFYFMAQMQIWAWNKEIHDTNNKLNFWFAIGTLVILGVVFPIWLFSRITSLYKAKDQKPELYKASKEYYGIFFGIIRPNSKLSFVYIIGIIIRAAVLAALTLFLSSYQLAQTATMLGVTAFFIVYLILVKPFRKLADNLFCLLNEIILVIYLFILFLLSWKNRRVINIDSDTSDSGFILIGLSLLVPVISIGFGLIKPIKLIMRTCIKRRSSHSIEVIEGENAEKLKEKAPRKEEKSKEEKLIKGIPILQRGNSNEPFLCKASPVELKTREIQPNDIELQIQEQKREIFKEEQIDPNESIVIQVVPTGCPEETELKAGNVIHAILPNEERKVLHRRSSSYLFTAQKDPVEVYEDKREGGEIEENKVTLNEVIDKEEVLRKNIEEMNCETGIENNKVVSHQDKIQQTSFIDQYSAQTLLKANFSPIHPIGFNKESRIEKQGLVGDEGHFDLDSMDLGGGFVEGKKEKPLPKIEENLEGESNANFSHKEKENKKESKEVKEVDFKTDDGLMEGQRSNKFSSHGRSQTRKSFSPSRSQDTYKVAPMDFIDGIKSKIGEVWGRFTQSQQ